MPTLKQTQSENGSVTITSPHDIVVSNQPQRPTPLSDSSAINETKDKITVLMLSKLSNTLFIDCRSLFLAVTALRYKANTKNNFSLYL